LILDATSWHWIFLVNVPIAVVALLLGARLLQAESGRADAGPLDWLGVALLSPGLAGIVFGLSEIESHGGIGDPAAFGPIAAGLALVGLFVRHALRIERPLIDMRLMRSRGFSAAAATTFMNGAGLFGGALLLPLYYQVARGETALTAGLLTAPVGIGAALAMPVAGRMVDRVGGGRVALVGCVIVTAATLPLAAVSATTSFALLAVLLVARGVGIGAAMMPAMAAAYATLQSAQVPRATSTLNALQRVGGSVGTALLAVVLQHQTRAAFPGGAGGGLAPVAASERAQVAAPLASAFGHTFVSAAALTAAALVPALLLAREERSATAHALGTQT
jgi:EmrB/QacA subfamily drug resistance transporter